MTHRLLASDMDRTLLPNGLQAAEPGALERFRGWALRRGEVELAYVTGRHRSLAREVLREYRLPEPDWLVCSVGTEIYPGGSDSPLPDWRDHLAAGFDAGAVREWARARLPGARLQEAEKQSALKVSFYLDDAMESVPLQGELGQELAAAGLPARVVVSFDETEQVGLVDFLAPGSGKARALDFLRRRQGIPPGRILFAGDSGNDTDALLSGVCGVLVGNATGAVRSQLRAALAEHPDARIYFAERVYTAGILEGMAHFGWDLPPDKES